MNSYGRRNRILLFYSLLSWFQMFVLLRLPGSLRYSTSKACVRSASGLPNAYKFGICCLGFPQVASTVGIKGIATWHINTVHNWVWVVGGGWRACEGKVANLPNHFLHVELDSASLGSDRPQHDAMSNPFPINKLGSTEAQNFQDIHRVANEVQKQDRRHSHQHQRWTCKLYLSGLKMSDRPSEYICNTVLSNTCSPRVPWNITPSWLPVQRDQRVKQFKKRRKFSTAHQKGHEGSDSQHTKSGRRCHCVSEAKFHCLFEVKSRHALEMLEIHGNFNLWMCSDFAGTKALKSVCHQQAWSMHEGLCSLHNSKLIHSIILPQRHQQVFNLNLVTAQKNNVWHSALLKDGRN